MQSVLSIRELRDCLSYEHRLNSSRLGVSSPPHGPPPARWTDYLNEQEALRHRRQGQNYDHESFHQFHPLTMAPIQNVSMPADTLETIIRAIGQATRPPPSIPNRAPIPIRHSPRRPAPPPNNKGKGKNGGKGDGKKPNNRRGKRGERSKDPRRNQKTTEINAPVQESIAITEPPAIVTAPPVTITVIPNPISLAGLDGHSEDEDLSFLNEFANPEAPTTGEDIMMNADVAIEGDFSI